MLNELMLATKTAKAIRGNQQPVMIKKNQKTIKTIRAIEESISTRYKQKITNSKFLLNE